jgi:hypothetical protein
MMRRGKCQREVCGRLEEVEVAEKDHPMVEWGEERTFQV